MSTAPLIDPDGGPGGPPLRGVRVLDLSRVLAGPHATMLLADLGADVIKVEHPHGDETRRWGPPFNGDHATYFLAANRNKRSVTLDLTEDGDRRRCHELVAEADVVVHNFLPRVASRFEVDHDHNQRRNPAVITCVISGYGAGAGADRPGYDFLAQAEAGLMGITGPPGQPTKVGVAVSDLLTGLHAVIGVLAALAHRTDAGVGQEVTINLFSSTLASLANQASGYLDGGVVPAPMGNRHPSIAPYQTLATADGAIAVAVGSDRQFARLLAALDRPDLLDDPRFRTNAARVEAARALEVELESVMTTAPSAHWLGRLSAAGVPCSQVNDLAGAFEAAAELGLRSTIDMRLADGTVTRQVAAPISFARTPVRYDLPPPILDEHGPDIRGGRGWPIIRRGGLAFDQQEQGDRDHDQ